MPALDIFRAWIHSSKGQTQGKKLRKQSTLRSKKAGSVTSSSTDTPSHGRYDIPPASQPISQVPGNIEPVDLRRRPSVVQDQRSVYTEPPHAPSHLYEAGPYPTPGPQAPTPRYPLETQYYEYEYHDEPSTSTPLATSSPYPPIHSTIEDSSWQHPSLYDTPGQSFLSEHQPNFYIEPSEPDDWSPIPDVHRQSTSSEDEFQSMHGTFGLGDRSSRRGVDSMVSDGRWTNRAEYDQSAMYELHEEDPDTSRQVSSFYPPHSRPMDIPSRTSSHRAEARFDDMGPAYPQGMTTPSHATPHAKDRQLPPLDIPAPHPRRASQPPVLTAEQVPSRNGSVQQRSRSRDRGGTPRSAPESHEPPLHAFASRQSSIQQPRGHDPSPENRITRPVEHGRIPAATSQSRNKKSRRAVSPESIPEKPEVYERDYGSDDEVYQYIVPKGVDVIFRDATGNEITRIGEFPSDPPPLDNKQSKSAPMVVLDEHGNELYRNFTHSSRRRGFKYDGHILHDERRPRAGSHSHTGYGAIMPTPRSVGSNSSRTSTKTFLIDEKGNQIPIPKSGSSNGSNASSSRPTRRSSRNGTIR